jgi:hypothetical protein
MEQWLNRKQGHQLPLVMDSPLYFHWKGIHDRTSTARLIYGLILMSLIIAQIVILIKPIYRKWKKNKLTTDLLMDESDKIF